MGMKRILSKSTFLLCAATLASICVSAQYNAVKNNVPVFKKDTVSIATFGAISDGLKLNTVAINNAINALHQKGGGVVLVPQGLWLTGPIVLKSNINLHVQQGAILLFSPDFNQYKLVEGNWEGWKQMRNQSPISATGVTNVAITGKGIIDGNGGAWRQVKKEKLTDGQWKKLLAGGGILSEDKKTWYPPASNFKGTNEKNPGVISPEKTPAYYQSVKDFLRPNMIVFTS